MVHSGASFPRLSRNNANLEAVQRQTVNEFQRLLATEGSSLFLCILHCYKVLWSVCQASMDVSSLRG